MNNHKELQLVNTLRIKQMFFQNTRLWAEDTPA